MLQNTGFPFGGTFVSALRGRDELGTYTGTGAARQVGTYTGVPVLRQLGRFVDAQRPGVGGSTASNRTVTGSLRTATGSFRTA